MPRAETEGADQQPGTLLGGFVVLSVLGEGGMGAVYEAYDADLDRKVAIKVIRSDILRGSASLLKSRMLQEARALARLAHPNVVTVFAVHEEEGQLFIVMEYVKGQTLTEWLKEEERSWQEILTAFVSAAKGLAAAHDAGLVHRDFKPDNVLVGEDGRICVTDFGLARLEGGEDEAALAAESPILSGNKSHLPQRVASDGSIRTSLTQTGLIMGTPDYMSPEQHLGTATDARTDQFSFCVTLYRAVFGGQRPFEGDSLEELRVHVTGGEVQPPPEKSDVPLVVRDAIMRGLACEIEDRFPSMEELIGKLESSLAKRSWALKLALVAVIIAVAGSALAVGMASQKSESQACQGAKDAFAEVWNANAKQEVQTAFLATGSSFAEKASDSVTQGLDRYAVQWADTHKTACEATHVRGEQSERVLDLRMLCLERKRNQVKSLVGELKLADRTTVANAARAGFAVGELDECNDVPSLTSPIDLPKNKETEVAISGLRERLYIAQTKFRLGKFKATLPEVESIVAEADKLDYAPLAAEAYMLLGQVLWRNGRFVDSEDALATAAAEAEAGRHIRVKVSAWVELIYVVGFEMGDANAAARWRKLAEAGLSRLSSAQRLRGKMLAWSAGAMYRGGDFQGGIDSINAAYEVYSAELEEGHFVLGDMTNWLAVPYQEAGEYAKAKELAERGLKIRSEALGEEHPDVAESLNYLGNAQAGLGDIDGAEATYKRGLEIWKAAYGEDHPRVAVSFTNLALIAGAKGDLTKAHELLSKALNIEQRSLGTEHPTVAATLGNLGKIHAARGELEIAEDHFLAALSILTDTFGASHPDVAQWRTELGEVLVAQGHYRDAVSQLLRARSVWDKRPTLHARRGETEFALAKAQWASGQVERAFDSARRALSAYDHAGPAHSEAQAEVDKWLNEE